MRFEAEAPVDDILVATEAGGFIAIQVKTTASLSQDPDSAFGRTIDQFVRHWLACRGGDGSLRWNRPIDPSIDRLVLAVGPRAPSDIREELPAALRLASQPGGGTLTKAQERVFDVFAACTKFAWERGTTIPYDPGFARTLGRAVSVLVVDASGTDRIATLTSLDALVESHADAAGLLTGLEAVCGDLMTRRGGTDSGVLRQALLSRGVHLRAPRKYRNDIERLRTHSNAIAGTLASYEFIEVAHGAEVTIDRDCQAQIRKAADDGPLLVVGEPGAGKSGVLNALSRGLRREGADVLQLAVDRYSVETLEGLGKELGLEHGLAEVLQAWDGAQPAWLIVDALDATRGGHGEGAFRNLIDEVIRSGGRWRVVASIRTFDLRMGRKFKTLFKGRPPIPELREVGLETVRHVRVPSWSRAEFENLLSRSRPLALALERSPLRLRELAMVPFNTRLIGELIKDGSMNADFSRIDTQADLLRIYWDHRVEGHGAPALDCIREIAQAMVDARALRAPFGAATRRDPAVLDTLEREGVLISVEGRRWVQFRHHLLFDFAAARVLLDPDALIAGRRRFDKASALGLMLAPALTFLLREIWDRDLEREDFWSAATHLLTDNDGDPVVRSATGRACAENPTLPFDTTALAKRVVSGDGPAIGAFAHVSGAVAIRIEDNPDASLAPWVALVRGVASAVAQVADTVRFLLFCLKPKIDRGRLRDDVGFAARALLEHLLTLDEPGRQVAAAIELVAETFNTDAQASRTLLARVFEPERLERFSSEEVPALCRQVASIAPFDPDFVASMYVETYGFGVEDERRTSVYDSQIMGLSSTARQDYGMARYALGEFIERFLSMAPAQAVAAIVQVTEAHVAREHARHGQVFEVKLEVQGRSVRLREDFSCIWAHDPREDRHEDAQVLVRKLLGFLETTDGDTALSLVDELTTRAGLAIFWSRLFIAAVTRKDVLVDLLLPVAMQEPFLVLPDTRKDAADLVAEGYQRLAPDRRARFEQSIPHFNFLRFESPDDARASLERRLFGAIGVARLATEPARAIAVAQDGRETVNDRLLTIHTRIGAPEPYHWIDDLDRAHPGNVAIMRALDATRGAVEALVPSKGAPNPDAFESCLGLLETLASAIDRGGQHPSLMLDAEGEIAKGVSHLVDQGVVPPATDEAGTARLMALLRMVVRSVGPTVGSNTEASFEKNASWGSPAPRVDAAEGVFDLVLARPDLYPALETWMDELLEDPHPAVRLEAALRLLRLWDLDRPAFRRRLGLRLAAEDNQGVLDHLCPGALGHVLHADPVLVDEHVQALLLRFPVDADRQARMRKQVGDLVAVLWVDHARPSALATLERWLADPAAHVPELSKGLSALRMAFVAGLGQGGRDDGEVRAVRRRAQEVARRVAIAASSRLLAHYEARPATHTDTARSLADLMDTVCRELFFACGAGRDRNEATPDLDVRALGLFLAEVGPILQILGDCGTPHTIYYLLQLLEHLLPGEPARAFDLAANALLGGGRITGYHLEPMGADLLVRLVGRFLADHKELFEDGARRDKLVDCLEVFMNAGWTSARRLLYRLPELIQ